MSQHFSFSAILSYVITSFIQKQSVCLLTKPYDCFLYKYMSFWLKQHFWDFLKQHNCQIDKNFWEAHINWYMICYINFNLHTQRMDFWLKEASRKNLLLSVTWNNWFSQSFLTQSEQLKVMAAFSNEFTGITISWVLSYFTLCKHDLSHLNMIGYNMAETLFQYLWFISVNLYTSKIYMICLPVLVAILRTFCTK